MKTIEAHFYTYVDSDGNSYSDALVGLVFSATHTWGSNCAECSWTLAGNSITSTTKSETVTIPNNGNDYIVSWEQSTSSDGKVLMGITITTDTSTLLLGEIGPVKQPIQYLGGPIHGVKWTYEDLITSVQIGYWSCYCDQVGPSPTPSTVVLGE